MNFKKFFAAAAACAVAAFSSIAMTVSAAEIAYTGPGAGAIGTSDSGTDYRVNIYNVWGGNNVTDINPAAVANENIVVTFTISGLNGRTSNVDDLGNPTTAYEAWIGGSASGNTYHGAGNGGNNVENTPVAITGDGQYKAEFKLNAPAGSIECLYLQSNINIFQLGAEGDVTAENCGINIKIDKIETDASVSTGGGDTTPTDANTDNNTNTNTDNNTNTNTNTNNNTNNNTSGGTTNNTTGGSTSGSTSGNKTNTNSSGGAILGSSTQVNSTTTGDNGIAVAVAGLVVAAGVGAAAVALRNKKH